MWETGTPQNRDMLELRRTVFLLTGFVTTLLANPKGPIELGNPNTYVEVKLYLSLFYAGSRNSWSRV